MSRIAYVNGRYVPHGSASVHIEDRGYQFSDGIYEVVAVHEGRFLDNEGHLDRLERSLSELRMDRPMDRGPLVVVMKEVVRRNRLRNGFIYMQVTRGVAPRNHAFPKGGVNPALVITARHLKPFDRSVSSQGVKVITVPDIRWKRPDIKTVGLLPNALAKQKAEEAGCYEAWQVDAEGNVTEGTLSNAWIVTAGGELVTRQADNSILCGITRLAVMKLAEGEGVTFTQRAFSVEEAKAAREAFLTSTTGPIRPVVQIDDTVIGNREIGPLTEKLLGFFEGHLNDLARS